MREGRILLIEDDQMLREVIAEALSEDGYAVDTAPDGAAALEVARRWRPGLVILDLMMPNLDGEGFVAAMREVEGLERVPIIVVSASRFTGEVGLRVGAEASLRKPFDLYELSERVRELLG